MTTATVSSILECKDVNEKIVLCESHVSASLMIYFARIALDLLFF